METITRRKDHPSYPSALLDLPGRKLLSCETLRTRGPWPAPPGVAIVGTRGPTGAALAFTRSLAAALVDAGFAVWSGGARGIDAAAHEAAMERGGRTVLVSPSGLAAPYPAEHAALFERVLASGGTLVSPFEDDARPLLASFHRRNAALAALTLATVVVQAGEKSGARSTARAARKLGRPLYVVPHAPWDRRGVGCAIELADGARAIVSGASLAERLRERARLEQSGRGDAACGLARSFEEEHDHASGGAQAREQRAAHALARDRARARAHEHVRARTLQALDPDATRVLEAIGEVPMHMDDLCERTALPFATVTAALLTLTLGAVVVEAPAGFYRRSAI